MSLRQTLVVAGTTGLLIVAALASLALGAVHIPVHDVISALDGRMSPGPLREIVLRLRLPRTVDALVVGAALGTAGALLQGALANPLASPDVIGVTSGAGFGALLILLAVPSSIALLPLGALVTGLAAAGLVFLFAWSGPNGGSVSRTILAGIAISSLFTAGTTLLLTLYPNRVQSAVYFLAGGLTDGGWADIRSIWPYFAFGFVLAILLTAPLDRLALGDDVAASLGTRPRAVRLGTGIAAALLAAASAALAGLLGFIGLVVPHIVRLAGGTSRHTFVVPVSAIAGAALLELGDTLARSVDAPLQLPVGPLMVALGVPLFIYLLRRST